MNRKSFTLMELLMVIAIIALLLSLLLPSLQKARNSAIMAVCKSNISQIIKANYAYSNSNDRYFMDREAAQSTGWGLPHTLYFKKLGEDDRDYFVEMDLLNVKCPFTDYEIDLSSNPSSSVYYSYSVYFGWKASDSTNLIRVEKPIIFQDVESTIAVTDIMHTMQNYTFTKVTHTGKVIDSYSENYKGGRSSAKQDMNFGRIDGSASTIKNAQAVNDPRMRKLPYELNAAPRIADQYLLIPKEQ